MITFKKFLTQFNKKYVCLKFDDATNENLRKYATINGFDLTVSYDGDTQSPSEFEFHITLYYTTTKHNLQNVDIKIDPIKIIPKRIKLLGKENDVPVVQVELNDDLIGLRQLFTSQGFRDAWPNYIPHISLSYNKRKYIIDNIPLPDFNIVANRMFISDVK